MATTVGFTSNHGRNLRSIADRTPGGAGLGVVVSNSADTSTLNWADECGIPSEVVERDDNEVRESHEERILDALADYNFDLVCLGGYTRMLTSTFFGAAPMTFDAHLSLLPALPGMNAHEQVLDAGVKMTGCTVHVVNEEVDAGSTVTQEAVPVYTNNDADDLRSCAFYDAEFKAYPRAVR